MERPNERTRGLPAALIIYPLLAAAVFLPFMGAPFIFDDIHTIRDNPYLREHLSPAYFFSHPEAASAIPANMIRPVLTWTYAVDHHWAGPDPRAFRAVNLALHILNAWLLFGLMRMSRRLKGLAFAGGLIFLIHPLASAQIGCVSNRSVLLSSTFYLAALLSFAAGLKAERRGRMGHWLKAALIAGMAALYAAGLFTKEAAATLPAAVILWGLAFGGGGAGRGEAGARRSGAGFTVVTAAALLALFGAYLWYRRHFSAAVLFPAARPWEVWQYGAAQVRGFWTYARLMCFPVNLSIEHEAWVPAAAGELLSAGFILSLVGLAALAGALVISLRRAPELGFAGLFSLLYLSPTSSVIPLTAVVNENRPYLSMVLFLWPLLLLLEAAGKRRPKISRALYLAVLVCFAAGTHQRGAAFAGEVRAWRDAVEKAPGLSQPHVNLGTSYLAYGRSDEAEHSLMWALRIDPCSAPALTDLGNIGYGRGAWQDAEQYYQRALDCDPGSALAMLNLADLLMETGREAEAAPLLTRALALYPTHAEILGRLGLYYVKHDADRRRGLEFIRKAAEFAPAAAESEKWRRLYELNGG
ncbi:MAG TPA: tetratricopeptide repeat protein [bacterium]|nr:tetratricopeptide repeat protein [bacterium]